MGNLSKRQRLIRLGVFLSVATITGVPVNLALAQPLAPQQLTQAKPKSGQEILTLKTQLQILMAEYPFLTAGISLVELDTGNYVNLDGEKSFPAASTIKLQF